MRGHSARMKSRPANKLFDPESPPVAMRKTTDESDDGMRQVFGDGVHDISTISYIDPIVHKQASALIRFPRTLSYHQSCKHFITLKRCAGIMFRNATPFTDR